MATTLRRIVLTRYAESCRWREEGKRDLAEITALQSSPAFRRREQLDRIKTEFTRRSAQAQISTHRNILWTLRDIRRAAMQDGAWKTP